MAELHPIPVDPLTGLPLPLAQAEKPMWLLGPTRRDYDHSWFPSNDPGLKGPAGRALRFSLGQWVRRWEHELKNKKAGPPLLPADEHAYFQATVAGIARMIGPYAIDFTSDDWTVPVLMTPRQYAYVTDPRNMYMQGGRNARPGRFNHVRDHIGKYFAAYAIDHGLGQVVTPRVVDEFLDTKDPTRKTELGNLLLRESVEAAVAPIMPVAQEIREMSPTPSPVLDPRTAVHRCFQRERFADYFGLLTERLTALQAA